MAMAGTQVARAAAQLHQAALDVARVAARRGAEAEAETQVTNPPAHAQVEFAGDRDDEAVDRGDASVPADGPDVC
jgi:hypothetical protein